MTQVDPGVRRLERELRRTRRHGARAVEDMYAAVVADLRAARRRARAARAKARKAEQRARRAEQRARRAERRARVAERRLAELQEASFGRRTRTAASRLLGALDRARDRG